jgi:hypothetical protein
MNIENLAQLSFAQLSEIQNRIQLAIGEKKNVSIADAVSDILDLLATKYPEVSLAEVLSELAFRSQITLGRNFSFAIDGELNQVDFSASLESLGSLDFSIKDVQVLSDRLKVIRNSILQSDDSRILWLTNDGVQKTSKMFGKELAEVLQESIKKLERLDNSSGESEEIYDLSLEVKKIEEWTEFRLGISLLSGTLTVINPLFSRRDPANRENPRLSQRSPASESGQAKSAVEIDFPLRRRRIANH